MRTKTFLKSGDLEKEKAFIFLGGRENRAERCLKTIWETNLNCEIDLT